MQLPAAVGGRNRVPGSFLDFPLFILSTFGIEINAQNSTCPWLNRRLLNLFQRQQHFLAPVFFFFYPWILNQWADDNMNNSSTVLQVWAKALRVNHKSTQRKTNKLLEEEGVPRTPRQGSTPPLHAAALCSLTKVAVQ